MGAEHRRGRPGITTQSRMETHVQTNCSPCWHYRAHVGLHHWPCTQERGGRLWRANFGRHGKRAEEVSTLQAQRFLKTRQASMTTGFDAWTHAWPLRPPVLVWPTMVSRHGSSWVHGRPHGVPSGSKSTGVRFLAGKTG